MTWLVNFFAGPGAGKSTMAAQVFANLKMRGINCELAREYAKDVVWEGRTHLLENQLYIFAKQAKRIKDLDGKVDFIITDSPILLSLAYGEGEPDSFKQLVRDVHNSYNNVNVYVKRDKPYVEAGRMQTFDEAVEMDRVILDLLNHGQMIIDLVVPGTAAGADKVIRYLLD